MGESYVVTGGGRGVGRAIVERLVAGGGRVVVIEFDPEALAWTEDRPGVSSVVGDASEEGVAERAADLAQEVGALVGWVNNAAVFRDVGNPSARELLGLVAMNFEPAVVGCVTAVRRFLDAGTRGAIVNVSSHQAQRPVRGALPYATAKAAIEGFSRALAVDYGPRGIRTNVVALGSITTERYEAFLGRQAPEEVARIENEMRLLHPVGRVGRPDEVAAAVAFLLSDEAASSTGPWFRWTAGGMPWVGIPKRSAIPCFPGSPGQTWFVGRLGHPVGWRDAPRWSGCPIDQRIPVLLGIRSIGRDPQG
ncbi:SDR family NAD(P)-dependent oxidoreductase [Actinomadura madurae]|uniref:SDR family NAD(P)-dependent oxidoreductase n=1 Tax=Actinomadura madurae TaxID=1993 RepID=UPI0020D1F6F1|nr:SDR family oxidoreductase [Actinomadura madurae]MCP9981063.1 SDR family oxidoreductase [Actinomadura madurae]